MAKKSELKDAAARIGTAIGEVDGAAHRAARKAAGAAHVASQELIALGKQVDKLKRQLEKSTQRLKSALK